MHPSRARQIPPGRPIRPVPRGTSSAFRSSFTTGRSSAASSSRLFSSWPSCSLPYLDRRPEGVGVWFARERRVANTVFAVLALRGRRHGRRHLLSRPQLGVGVALGTADARVAKRWSGASRLPSRVVLRSASASVALVAYDPRALLARVLVPNGASGSAARRSLYGGADGLGLRQIWIRDIDRVDRCTSCHLDMDMPTAGDAPPSLPRSSGRVARRPPCRRARVHDLPRWCR